VTQYTQEKAAFFVYGPWNIQDFLTNKNIDFDVSHLPWPDGGRKGYLEYPRQAVTVSFAAAHTKIPQTAVKYMEWRWGPEAETQMVKMGLGSSAISYVNKPEYFPSQQAAHCAQLLASERRVPPDVIRRNSEESATLEIYHDPSPDIQALLQGIMSGQVADYKTGLKDLSDKMNAGLDSSIKAAQAKGAKVSRNDWVFPNWDPTKDYEDAEYKALK